MYHDFVTEEFLILTLQGYVLLVTGELRAITNTPLLCNIVQMPKVASLCTPRINRYCCAALAALLWNDSTSLCCTVVVQWVEIEQEISTPFRYVHSLV